MTVRSVLVVKLADLGDVLLCEPAIRSLRTAFPEANLDILVPPTSAGIVELIGHNTTALEFPKHAFDDIASVARPARWLQAARFGARLHVRKYDAVVILHHLTTSFGAVKFRALAAASGAAKVAGLDNGRGSFLTHAVKDLGFGAMHEAEYMLEVAIAAGGQRVSAAPTIEIGDSANSIPIPPEFVVVFPVTGPYSSARTWPTRRYAEVIDALKQRGWPTVIVGGDDAVSAASEICALVPSATDLTGRTNLKELAHVIQRSAAAIGGDSFIGHFAAALGRPVVSIFGPSNAAAWRPYERKTGGMIDRENARNVNVVVRNPMPCAPCIYAGYSLGRPAGCPARTCLETIGSERVVEATIRILEAHRSG